MIEPDLGAKPLQAKRARIEGALAISSSSSPSVNGGLRGLNRSAGCAEYARLQPIDLGVGGVGPTLQVCGTALTLSDIEQETPNNSV